MSRALLAFYAAVASLVLLSTNAHADEELARLFPREVDVLVPSGEHEGLLRVLIPAEVLQSTRGDLADLRLFDNSGREVPFMLDSASRALWARQREMVQVAVKPRAVTQRRIRRDEGTVWREELVVETPREPPPSGRWSLVFDTPRSHFVSQLTIVDDDDTERVLSRGTLFRLQSPLREGVRVPLPVDLPARVRVVLSGEQSHLEPSMRFESVRVPSPQRLRLPLDVIERQQREHQTVITLRRPGGIVPDRIELSSTTGSFFRNVTITDAGQGASAATLGADALFRVADLDDAERLGVWLTPAAGDRLTVVIDDGDSPPLDELELVAVIDQPAMLFELDGRGVLRFGGGRAHAPGYDLQRLVGTRVGARLAREGQITDVVLGEPRDNPAFDPAPALGYLMRAGPAVDSSRFSHRRRIEVKGAREGLSRLRLLPNDLAHARDDLGDLRVVDDRGRQWPYLVERADVSVRAPVTIGAPESEDGETRYALGLPATPLSLSAIELSVDERYVDRPYRLLQIRDGREHTVISGRLTRRPGERAPLRLSLPSERFAALVLVVDDANDPPLRLLAGEAELPSADVYIAARDGSYWLLVGDSEGDPARYQMARARDLALALPSGEVHPGAFEANPEYRAPDDEQGPKKLLWASLVVAVLALGGLTLRVARSEPAVEEDSEPARPSEPEVSADE